MLRLAADENFNNNIIRGLLRRKTELDIVRVQEFGLSGAGDTTVLEWVASQNRVLLTHDVTTITKYAYERIKTRQPIPGIFAVRVGSIGLIIEDILLLVECSLDGEWEGQIIYLPLK